MAQSTRTNISQNYLSPLEFRFLIHRLPYTEFFTQSANIPGVSMSPAVMQTPFKEQYFSPDKLDFADFTVQFRVDENMNNYIEIVNWMKGLAFPDRFSQYANLINSDGGLYSDATLMILTNGKNPNINLILKDIFPTNLSDLQMDTKQTDVDYVTCDVTFKINNQELRIAS